MSIINKGTAFSNGEQLTADKLNDLIDLATFDQSATDSASTTVNTSGQIVVKDSGVSTAKILDASVTFAKLTDVIDDDTMGTATATNLATSESIKAYVDTEITDHGITQTTGTAPYFGVRAWANYNGTSDTLNASGNIASVTKNGTGLYTFTFTTAMPDTNYAVSLSYSNEVNGQHGVGFINKPLNTTHFQVAHYDASGSGRTTDKEFVFISVIR